MSPPPPILEGSYISPGASAHLYYIEIDSPAKTNRNVYRGYLMGQSPLDYVVVNRNEPELLYVMVGAVTPGIYDLEIGGEVRYRNEVETKWLRNLKVYFTPRKSSISLPDNPLDLLKARIKLDPWNHLWDIHRAIERIGHEKPIGAFEELRSALLDGVVPLHHQLVEPACEAIVNVCGSKAFETLVQVFLECRYEHDSIWGATAGLARINDKRSNAFLTTYLQKPSYRSRMLYGLRGRIPESIVPIVVDILEKCDDASDRSDAAEALQHTNNETALSALLKIAKDEQLEPHLRSRAAESISHCGDLRVAAGIAEMLRSEDDWLRERTVDLLANFSDVATKEALRMAMRDTSSSVRTNAAKSLVILGDIEAFGLIDEASQKADAYEREDLLESMVQLASVPQLLFLWQRICDDADFKDYKQPWLLTGLVDRLTELTGERLGFYYEDESPTSAVNRRLLDRWKGWCDNRVQLQPPEQ